MSYRHFLTAALCMTAVLWGARFSSAAGGTAQVATTGQPAYVSPSWPEGAGNLVNDSSRTTGWNSWFSEWPNDVNQYAFAIESTDDLNRLIAKLAAIKTELRQIRLSYLKEPKGLGWVTQLPEGNGIPVIFSIGDQARIDEWYRQVRKPFGAMEFTSVPEAVPPTLTIFVQNKSVKLDELKIPEGVEVSIGYVPTVFHRSNTTLEQPQTKETTKQDQERESIKLKQSLDESSLATLKKLEAFIDSREPGTAK